MTVCHNIKPTQYVVVKVFELAVLWLNDKCYQEKLYTVKPGIIVNRPVPFTEMENISSVNRTGV